MHPAPSIIVFTVLSGLGYGLAAVLGLGLLDPAALSTKLAHFIAIALIVIGLLASTLHLGNPQRAWRAMSQWRSSWLSREGVAAIISLMPITISAAASIFYGQYLPILGIIGALTAAVTVYCTSMIYASLKSIDAWHTPLTSAVFLLFSLSGGLAAASLFATIGESSWSVLLLICALLAGAAAWGVSFVWRNRLKTTPPTSTTATATALGNLGRIRPFEHPHTEPNYLMREMGFQIARKHAEKLGKLALILGAGITSLLLVAAVVASAQSSWALAALAASAALSSHMLGVLVARWLFFAEARHSVMSFYAS